MTLQALALGELRGALTSLGLGRLGDLCAGGGKAMFIATADLSMLATECAAINDPMVCCGAWEGTLQHARGQRSRQQLASPSTVRSKDFLRWYPHVPLR